MASDPSTDDSVRMEEAYRSDRGELKQRVDDFGVWLGQVIQEMTQGAKLINSFLWQLVKMMLLITGLVLMYVISSGVVGGFIDFATGAIPTGGVTV